MLVKKIPNGPDGIAETVTAIIAYAHEPETTAEIREIALLITHQAGARTELQKAKAIHDWVKDRIRYDKDPIYREFVQQPLWLIREGFQKSHKASGDCDDHCAVNMALLGSLGFSTRAVVTEDPSNPGPSHSPHWAHIYCETQVRARPDAKRKWVPIDSSMWFLKFGTKVGGKNTHIYPGDIPPDIYFDSGRGRQGLGYVAKAIELGTPYVNKIMKKRTNGGKSLFGFTVNGINGVDGLGNSSQHGLGWVGIVTGGINAVTGIITGAIGSKTQKYLAKKQTQVQLAQVNAQARLQEKAQQLEFQSRQLDAERQNLLNSEQLAFERLRSASKKDKITAAALVGVPLVAIFALNFFRGKKED